MNQEFIKWIKRITLIFAFCSVVIAIGLYIVGLYLIAPASIEIAPPPSNTNWVDLEFKSVDGLICRGWYGEGLKGKGCVVLIHGVRSNRLQMVNRARFLQKKGSAVLLFDLQAHGESEGENITFGYREANSVKGALKYLHKILPEEKIAVIGVSLGGAAFLLGDSPIKADAVILEGVYATVEEAILNRLTIRFGWIGRFGAPLLLHQIPFHLNISGRQLRPVESVKKLSSPVFIIGGALDRRTVPEETIRIYEAAPEPKEIWLVEGAKHVDFFDYGGDKYKKKISVFLEKYLWK